MLNRRRVFQAGIFAGRPPKVEVRRFTPTLEDILLSIDGKSSTPSDFRPGNPASFGSEQRP